MTLYDNHKQACDRLSKEGFPAVAEMTRHFRIAADMDRALGYENATARWVGGRGLPGVGSERKARKWLDDAMSAKPAFPEPPAGGIKATNTLLVCCQPDQSAKVLRVLAMLGCEVVEV